MILIEHHAAAHALHCEESGGSPGLTGHVIIPLACVHPRRLRALQREEMKPLLTVTLHC